MNIIDLPGDENKGKIAFTIENFLSEKECNEILELIKFKKFQKATIGDNKKSVETDTRNNSRTFIEDHKFSEKLWNKFKSIEIIPKTMTNGVFKLSGLYKHTLFYKYNEGEYFKEHFDGDRKDLNKKSFFTVLIYLNEDFEGGETTFIHHKRIMKKNKLKEELVLTPIKPKKGQLLVFRHNILHEGSILKSGEKIVLRSDIMYEKN
jgi:Rps23 Pro-64 3,4-dihydroxylase Tpa1-like proline 4-hydroxylase